MATLTSQMIESVQEAHKLDEASLLSYLFIAVEGFPRPPVRLSVSQFGHGQSNPTYLLKAESNNIAPKFYVLRKKPPGKLLQSAHAVEREYQILEALAKEGTVPVPKVFCLCNDSKVIGTPFFVMEYVQGRIFLDPGLKSLKVEERKPIYEAIAKTLASIHKVDVDRLGLGKYGRRENYCKRQIDRWSAQYAASISEGKPPPDPAMLKLINWLRSNVPSEDAQKNFGGIVHGDFKIDNLVFHPKEPRVIAVLDWELSTLGNRMSDVSYVCMPFVINNRQSNGPSYYGFENGVPSDGIPSQTEFISSYCSEAGVHWPGPNWNFYLALSLFRLAAICAGVYNRFLLGNASGGTRAQSSGKFAVYLASRALQLVEEGSVIPDVPPSHIFKGNIHPGLSPSPRVLELQEQLSVFMEKFIYPNEERLEAHANSEKRWTIHPLQEELKRRAQAEGLWNLWIPADSAALASKVLVSSGENSSFNRLVGAGLSNLEYGHLCEIMGRSLWAPEVFNCSAPDTGNMEVLLRYGSPEQQKLWLKPLLEGKIRSGFAMTEPAVASSDATNIECKIERQGKHYIINGRKWWTSGAMDPRCNVLIVMGKTDLNAPLHKQQSMILVDVNTPGVEIVRPLTVFGFDDAPHGHAEVVFRDVKVPAENIIWSEGRGFEIAQGRLGPGRLHHCMRLIGSAERALELMIKRATQRTVFGRAIARQGSFASEVAEARLEITQTRLLVLHAANELDNHGVKVARGALAMAKVAAPRVALKVLDSAIQVHGAAGVSSDTVLAHLWAAARTLRIADGPDDVHLQTIAKLELRRAKL